MRIEDIMRYIKEDVEYAIQTSCANGKVWKDGHAAKQSLIRGSGLIQYIHEYLKIGLLREGYKPYEIYPPIGKKGPELQTSGMLKKKQQDVSVLPEHVIKDPQPISWGPLAYEKQRDDFGPNATRQILSVNVRSQLSSIHKNSDTLFERTYAEATNLHALHKDMVLGEVYMVALHEYEEDKMKENEVSFNPNPINVEKYISFFDAINKRKEIDGATHKYERCALLLVDFRKEEPVVYQDNEELIRDGYLDPSFPLQLKDLNIDQFYKDLLGIYKQRFQHQLRRII